MGQKTTNRTAWAIIVVAILAVGAYLIFNKSAVNPVATDSISDNTNTVADTITNPTNEPESVQDTSGQTGGVAPVTLSYANALIKYADRRIQLNATCQAYPYNVTYKDNTGIMIYNRSPNTRTVKVGTTFTIKPWGFRIVVLPDIYLKSKTILVDCDKMQNVATILVQE